VASSSSESAQPASLAGRVVAVAGAGGNLGPTVVQRLASSGARLALAGRRIEPLDALAAEVGGDIDTASVDLLDREAARGWASGVAERLGRVDGLVHIVGGWRGGSPIEEAALEDWDALEPLLVRTLVNATQAFTPHLLESGRGRVVVVSSGQAQSPTHANAGYAALKAAGETWTLALADRFRKTGCTANLVVVGAIVTPAMRKESPDKDFSTSTPAEEIAEAIAYLTSDAAASMNGQRLVLRGAA
jgi:NAD(P)-dependent dehydrogenase (short-subunit alcohol dehydrogenase family)